MGLASTVVMVRWKPVTDAMGTSAEAEGEAPTGEAAVMLSSMSQRTGIRRSAVGRASRRSKSASRLRKRGVPRWSWLRMEGSPG